MLRRYARALAGAQAAGDDHVAATLEQLVAGRQVLDATLERRVALFAALHRVWSAAGGHVEAPDPGEGELVVRAQSRLGALMPQTRVALLLESLEGFSDAEVGAIMGVTTDKAAELIEAGRQELQRQIAGRVLVIEDEPVIALDLKGIVESLGHAVVGIADTRDKAVAAAISLKPNLILADIRLSDGSSGIDAVNEILSSFATPVIFVTAYPERLLTGQRPEPAFLITKPFRESEVRAAVGQALFFDRVVEPG